MKRFIQPTKGRTSKTYQRFMKREKRRKLREKRRRERIAKRNKRKPFSIKRTPVSKKTVSSADPRTIKVAPTAIKAEEEITAEMLAKHKVYNSAKQHELKTLQEEKKAEGLAKKVEQEDVKKKKLKKEVSLMGMSQGLMVVVGLGILGALAHTIMKNRNAANATA